MGAHGGQCCMQHNITSFEKTRFDKICIFYFSDVFIASYGSSDRNEFVLQIKYVDKVKIEYIMLSLTVLLFMTLLTGR